MSHPWHCFFTDWDTMLTTAPAWLATPELGPDKKHTTKREAFQYVDRIIEELQDGDLSAALEIAERFALQLRHYPLSAHKAEQARARFIRAFSNAWKAATLPVVDGWRDSSRTPTAYTLWRALFRRLSSAGLLHVFSGRAVTDESSLMKALAGSENGVVHIAPLPVPLPLSEEVVVKLEPFVIFDDTQARFFLQENLVFKNGLLTRISAQDEEFAMLSGASLEIAPGWHIPKQLTVLIDLHQLTARLTRQSR